MIRNPVQGNKKTQLDLVINQLDINTPLKVLVETVTMQFLLSQAYTEDILHEFCITTI